MVVEEIKKLDQDGTLQAEAHFTIKGVGTSGVHVPSFRELWINLSFSVSWNHQTFAFNLHNMFSSNFP